MWSRRTFIVASCALATCRVTGASADIREEVWDWFYKAASLAAQNLDNILATVLHVVYDVRILIDVRTRVDDIRSKLTDSTPEHHLDVKLAEWLNNYNRWTNEKAKASESNADFAARHERSRAILASDWKSCALDAVGALQLIENLGIELESVVGTNAMPVEEWHKYRHLLDDEKMMIEVIKSDMPTEPDDIDRLRKVAQQLEQIVSVIDENAAKLNEMIAKYKR